MHLDFSWHLCRRAGAAACILTSVASPTYGDTVILGPEAMDFDSFDYLAVASNATGNGTNPDSTPSESDDGMAVAWYLISFGGLVVFFLLLSISEFCCKKSGLLPKPDISTESEDNSDPPPYELFAPPTYQSIFPSISDRKESLRASVYIIRVHEKPHPPQPALEFGEVIRRNAMGDGEVVTPPPPP